ncbi:MAG: glycosyl hydrolase 53 family protein, partial [Bacteroidales bacterium]
VVDTGGREVPTANNRVRFKVTGPAKIIGVGNGDPSSHEPDKCEPGLCQRSLFQGKCQVILQMGDTPGKVGFEAHSEGLWPASTEIHTLADSFRNMAPTEDQIRPAGINDKERIMGADISFLPQLEAEGMKFYDFGNNIPQDVFEILNKYGFNYIRLRIFYQPENPEGYSPSKGYCNLAQTLEMARRIKKAGMKFLLDFHYSDYWADPGKQYKPKAWDSLPFDILKDSVRNYTVRVLRALQAQNTLPDMIQPGNEINHGLLWPEGHISQPDHLADLLQASISGIKEVAPDIPIMLHLALGGQNDESVFWLNNMFARGIDCDVIGLSYYPRWHCTLDDLKYNMRDLIRRYGKDIIVVEYSQKKEEVAGAVFGMPNDKGKGCFIWEPLNTWEGIFDKNGKPTRWLHAYENIKAMYLDRNLNK